MESTIKTILSHIFLKVSEIYKFRSFAVNCPSKMHLLKKVLFVTLKAERMQHSLKLQLRGDTEEEAGWLQPELQCAVVLSDKSELLAE